MKVVFDFSKQQIAIEGDGPALISLLEKVREIAPGLTEINIVTSSQPTPADPSRSMGAGNGGAFAAQEDPTQREFAKSVSPATASERIVTIAVYAKRFQGKDTFSPKEMDDWFTHFGLRNLPR